MAPTKDERPEPQQRTRHDRDAVFDPDFREDLLWWVGNDRRVALRILQLVEAVMRDPFRGIGKPEPLRHWSSSAWSRRVSEADRLVYLVQADRITFLQCRYHYGER